MINNDMTNDEWRGRPDGTPANEWVGSYNQTTPTSSDPKIENTSAESNLKPTETGLECPKTDDRPKKVRSDKGKKKGSRNGKMAWYWTPEKRAQAKENMKKIHLRRAQRKIDEAMGGGSEKPEEIKKTETADPNYKKTSEIRHGGAQLIQGEEGLKLDIQLSEKQSIALSHPAQFLLYGGAKGGGKSWLGCAWLFLKAIQNKGNKLFAFRRRSVDFSNTTLETWKKSIPAKLYWINEQKKKIYITLNSANRNSFISQIDYGGLDDPIHIQGLNSAEYGGGLIDQAEEIEKDSFGMLRGTLRHRLADGSQPDYKILLTANPAQCWLKDMFILRPEKGCAYVPALPSDNPHLPKEYVENLREAFKHRPHLLSAYIDGSWDDLSGNDMIIRGKWIEEAKNRQHHGNTMKRVVVNDPAITGDENVVFLMETFGNGVSMVTDELIIEHQRPFETAARLAQFRRQTKAQLIAVDSIGIGAGVIDGLIQLEEPYLAINSSSRPTLTNKQVRFHNLRSQLWWEASEAFAEGKIKLDPSDFELASQLGSVKFDPATTGKLLVEPKDKIKERIGRSPDRADAFVMGLYALSQVNRIGWEEEQASEHDRQGRGERVYAQENEYISAGEDFSGYYNFQ